MRESLYNTHPFAYKTVIAQIDHLTSKLAAYMKLKYELGPSPYCTTIDKKAFLVHIPVGYIGTNTLSIQATYKGVLSSHSRTNPCFVYNSCQTMI